MKSTQPALSLLVASMLLICGSAPSSLAALVPGEHILKQVALTWKGDKGITLERQITGLDDRRLPWQERVYMRGGRVRIEGPDGTRVFSRAESLNASAIRRVQVAAPARVEGDVDVDADPKSPIEAPELEVHERPWAADVPFLQSSTELLALCKGLGIEVERVALARLPTPAFELPFLLLYRLGQTERPGLPLLEVEKASFLIRTLQFQEQGSGAVWRVEYDGYGAIKDVPGFLPTRMMVYRGGTLLEQVVVTRRISLTLKDNLFEAGGKP